MVRNQCTAQTKEMKRCRKTATDADGRYCSIHKNRMFNAEEDHEDQSEIEETEEVVPDPAPSTIHIEMRRRLKRAKPAALPTRYAVPASPVSPTPRQPQAPPRQPQAPPPESDESDEDDEDDEVREAVNEFNIGTSNGMLKGLRKEGTGQLMADMHNMTIKNMIKTTKANEELRQRNRELESTIKEIGASDPAEVKRCARRMRDDIARDAEKKRALDEYNDMLIQRVMETGEYDFDRVTEELTERFVKPWWEAQSDSRRRG